MAAKSSSATQPAERELVITRMFDAPRNLVFEAWTKPEHLVHWWGPRGFTLPTCEMDFRAGGAFRLGMRSPEGHDYWFQGVYREIVEPERIVFTGMIDEDPSHEVLTTVMFAEQAGKTRLTVRQTYTFESEATRGAQEGWTQSLDRLTAYLAKA